jgi:hypothetical protein
MLSGAPFELRTKISGHYCLTQLECFLAFKVTTSQEQSLLCFVLILRWIWLSLQRVLYSELKAQQILERFTKFSLALMLMRLATTHNHVCWKLNGGVRVSPWQLGQITGSAIERLCSADGFSI